MTDDTDRIPYDVYGRLGIPLGVLAADLGHWEGRDDTRAQPHVRRAANEAVDIMDAMLGVLHAMRRRLVSEMRESDDAAMRRSAEVLERSRRLREDDNG